MGRFKLAVTERFLRYVKIDTQSQANTNATPSTEKQKDLARLLAEELKSMGVCDVFYDEAHCLTYGKIKGNGGVPFGLIAHVDTAPDASGANVKPWIYENYPGGKVILNKELGIIMDPKDFACLNDYIGQDIVFTDGTTLLGGDDKASIAAIMAFADYLIEHPEIPHPDISIAFTPDEEVGGLAKDLDFVRFGAKVAYTLDGDHLGFYSDETFNAIEAQLRIHGRIVHTGTAKGIMVNAMMIANEILAKLPPEERPERTEGREGFFHPHYISATVDDAFVRILLRDFEEEGFAQRKRLIERLVEEANEKYGEGVVELDYKMGYSSMKKAVDRVPYLVPNLIKAIEEAGIQPTKLAFRGGTDGSALSARGLPCPNLSAGYENAHGPYEFVPIPSMEANVEILLHLAKIYAEQH